MALTITDTRWAVKWISNNRRDGHREHFIREKVCAGNKCNVLLFPTRAMARAFTDYDYIRRRPDLQAEPFGWRGVRVVKVNVTVSEVERSRSLCPGCLAEITSADRAAKRCTQCGQPLPRKWAAKIGKHNDSPIWAEVFQNVRDNRRRIKQD